MNKPVNRRFFLHSLALTGLHFGLALNFVECKLKNFTKKPNLLFIWTDQQRADTMAVYGNEKIKTPHLNKLANESFVFQKAYVSQPVCTPSRSTVLTGLWPHQNGCVKNNVPLRTETKCFPELLDDPEYKCAYMGKWHLGDELYAQHGFQEWVSMEDGYNTHFSPGRDKSKRSDYHDFLIKHGYQPNEDNLFRRSFAANLPIDFCKPTFLEQKSCEFLQNNQQKPFVLFINFLEPHSPFFGPLDNVHSPDEINLPTNFDDPLEDNEPLRNRLAAAKEKDRGEKGFRDLIAKYWGLVTQVDRSVGKILQKLEELGLADNTVVVYTSDHGSMMGSHKLVGKTFMYEESAKIPWLMRVPKFSKKQNLISQPVSHIDIVPTLFEVMGKKAPDNLPGQSLVPLFSGKPVKQDYVFMEWNSERSTKYRNKSDLASTDEIVQAKLEQSRAVVSPDGWKLSLSNGDKSQLYNLINDPGERTNLFDSGKHENVIIRLTKKIHQWQEQVGDKLQVGI
jgi:arylsulfatase A-like enzyme